MIGIVIVVVAAVAAILGLARLGFGRRPYVMGER